MRYGQPQYSTVYLYLFMTLSLAILKFVLSPLLPTKKLNLQNSKLTYSFFSFFLCYLGIEVWSTYEDPFPSPSYDEEDDHEHGHGHGHGHSHGEGDREDEQDNVTMILPSAAKILAAQNK